MEIERRVLKDGAVRWRVRWRQGGRFRSQTFLAAYQSWRRRAFKRAIAAAGLEHGRPYDLRHSFASLLLHEGRSVIYVARQLGHDARLTLSTYGHVMDEFEDTPRIDADATLAEARAAVHESAASSS